MLLLLLRGLDKEVYALAVISRTHTTCGYAQGSREGCPGDGRAGGACGSSTKASVDAPGEKSVVVSEGGGWRRRGANEQVGGAWEEGRCSGVSLGLAA